MNVSHFEPKKSAILFFDILNGYYHSGDATAKARMKPWVDNATRLMKAGRAAGLSIFFAKGNHRPDNTTSALILTDTNNSLQPVAKRRSNQR
jgi:ureidoacrylate peracid hydrolase